MKNRLLNMGAVLLAGAMLFSGGIAEAEEKRLGDYIYVPAISVPGKTGTISLRVEGIALSEESDTPVTVPSLAGAEFGVYVFSGDGELTPWANPLYPSEPMRIRTGEGETSFTLPQGVEFYLRQESAPQGYLFDETQLIKVEGSEIVVENRMAGELAICTQDSLGKPVAGVTLEITSEDGETVQAVTDEEGMAYVRCAQSGMYTVREKALPQGAFDALRVLINGSQADTASVDVELAARTRVTFEHPASGSVQLIMTLTDVDANGETIVTPLADVCMEIVGERSQSIQTDSVGLAGISLLEGLYGVRLSYVGQEDIILPLTEGQMLVESGATTKIELSATKRTGRIVVSGICEKPVSGGSMLFEEVGTGAAYGPYAFDDESILITDPLPAGEYRISAFNAPKDTQAGDVAFAGASLPMEETILSVEPGKAAIAEVSLLTLKKQTFSLYTRQIDDQGETVDLLLPEDMPLTLVDGDGQMTAQITAENGFAQIEALTGTYTLLMDEALAQKYGVLAQSMPFCLPAQEEAIVFACSGARLILVSVDENGEPVTGATYSVMDSTGIEMLVTADGDGQAVTPLLTAGQVRIEGIKSPENHDEAQVMTLHALAGSSARVEMVHPSYGTAALSANVQSVDETGVTISALDGVHVKVYRVESDGQTLVDTGLDLVTGADGMTYTQLKPGSYVAQIDGEDLPAQYSEGQALSFMMTNMQRTDGRLVCYDALGGVQANLIGGELTQEELAQVRFELVDENGKETGMMLMADGFCAGALEEGIYTLKQTQIPEGYTLAKEMTVEVAGGSIAQISVPLEEYAVLTVGKTGITFNDRMQTYIVPLTGEYGVYTMQDGVMMPYPSEEQQATVWANVSPEQIAMGRTAQLRLPAEIDGTTYYIREIGAASGFAPDETYHEVTLTAGSTAEIACAVSSDRGFFTFSQLDAVTGAHVPGGTYALVDGENGDTVLSFTLGEESYRNAMAVPVGQYVLRQLSAGAGYAMSRVSEVPVIIEPYLTQGGRMTDVVMTAAKIPAESGMKGIADMYAAGQQGLTLLMVEAEALTAGETLRVPQMTVRVASHNGERTDIGNVVLSGVRDDEGGAYAARVEYCLTGGGWQPSDARVTAELSAPVSVSLMDVEDDICAVRVTYLNAATGEEATGSGFDPGQISLNVEIGTEGEVEMTAEAVIGGEFVYRTERDAQEQILARSARREITFTAQGSGAFDTVSAGRDGRITGVVFFDENADGVMSAKETGRYAGMTVSLLNASMDVVATCRTDGNGRYAFSGISGGEYSLAFEAGEKLVFSSGKHYTQHVVSGVEDKHFGTSAALYFDGDHTDYVVNAGCIYAASVSGYVMEKMDTGDIRGFDGLNVDVMALHADEEEPVVVMTDDTGAFRVNGLLPGEYEMTITLPEEYLCALAEEGVITQQFTVAQGETKDVGAFSLALKASVSGGVYVDDDGDGTIAQDAQAIAGVSVSLLCHQDGHTQTVDSAVTDENGCYAFENLYDGEYSVLFELGGEWTFTRYGEDSKVYGAVSGTGSTQSFTLLPGEQTVNMNAGATLPAQMDVFVFEDEHADGQRGVYDVGLAGVTVSLIRQEDGEDAQEITLTTDRDGFATFEGVAPGEYVLAYQMPGSYRATKQVESDKYPTSCVPQTTLNSGRSEPFVLKMGESGTRKYIGAMLSGLISGTVYFDNDADARIGENETACAGVLIELMNLEGEVLDRRTSDHSGQYAFEGLAPGRYVVRFTAQEECGFSGTERSMTRGGVQKSSEHVATTRTLTVGVGGKINAADAGVVRMSSVRGMLFVDRDADCEADDNEEYLAGVAVHLMNGTARSILMSTTTDEWGHYAFERVTPGTYLIRIDAPEGYVFSGAVAGSPLSLGDERDGRGYSQAFELLGGAHAQGLGFGLLTQGSISGRVWIDEDYDGKIGEKEEGLRGAMVTLSDLSGSVVASKTTIRSGEFTFGNLMPGVYTLSVKLGEEYVFTADGGDSLMDRSNESSASLYLGELEMGGKMTDLTIGAIKPASVGGTVWVDENNDGRRADGEKGADGVKAVLTMITGIDAGKTIETTTDENGSYRIDNVMPGEAEITFEVAEGYAFAKKVSGTRMVSCVPETDALIGTSDVFTVASGDKKLEMDAGILPVGTIEGIVWQDSMYDGGFSAEESGVEGARVTLIDAANGEEISSAATDETGAYRIGFVRPGVYTLAFDLPEGMIFTREGEGVVGGIDDSNAQTERFTVAMGENISGISAGAIIPAAISGNLMIDANENGMIDGDEAGLADALITVMQGGTLVSGAKTQPDGSFTVGNLRPGTYRVRITLSDNALFAKHAALTLAEPDASEGETGEYVLEMGQHVRLETVPVVKAARVSGRAWLDANADGRLDGDEQPMNDVSAELLDVSGAVVAQTRVDENGEYAFDLLRSGEYAVRFTLGDDVLFADQTEEAGGSSVPVVPGNVGVTYGIVLEQGDAISDMNVGGILPGSIGDTVFLDANGNGLMDYREMQIPGVELELLKVEEDGTMTPAGLTVSDAYGYYRFGDLRPGSYVVRVLVRAGDVLTMHFGAPLGEIDSDVYPETGETDPISLVSGQILRNIDIGFTACER